MKSEKATDKIILKPDENLMDMIFEAILEEQKTVRDMSARFDIVFREKLALKIQGYYEKKVIWK